MAGRSQPWVLSRPHFQSRPMKSLKPDCKPWLAWLSWLGIDLQSQGWLVWFPVGAYARVVGQVPGWGGHKGWGTADWCFSPSLSPALPLSLKQIINMCFKFLTFRTHRDVLLHQRCKLRTEIISCWVSSILPPPAAQPPCSWWQRAGPEWVVSLVV